MRMDAQVQARLTLLPPEARRDLERFAYSDVKERVEAVAAALSGQLDEGEEGEEEQIVKQKAEASSARCMVTLAKQWICSMTSHNGLQAKRQEQPEKDHEVDEDERLRNPVPYRLSLATATQAMAEFPECFTCSHVPARTYLVYVL